MKFDVRSCFWFSSLVPSNSYLILFNTSAWCVLCPGITQELHCLCQQSLRCAINLISLGWLLIYNAIISTYNLGLINLYRKKKFSYLPYLVCWFEIKEPCIVTTAKKWLAKDGITKFRHSVTCMTRQPLSRKNNFGEMTVQCSGYICCRLIRFQVKMILT